MSLDDDLGIFSEGQAASHLLAKLAPALERRHRQVEAKIFDKITAGELIEPQFAVQCWLEKYEVHRLERQLKHRTQRGQAAAGRLAGQMETRKPPLSGAA